MAADWLDYGIGGIAAVTGAGLVQLAAGAFCVRRFQARPAPVPTVLPPVTILKPMHGDEPLLLEALSRVCAQDYPCFQIVFGLQSADDPALRILAELRRRFPLVDMAVVVDGTQHGANRKVGNLLNMLPSARHDVLLVADSDMHVAPDYLRRVVSAFTPGVGLVTSLYAGLPSSRSFAGLMGAAFINHTFLPGALMARMFGRQDCLGATMAIHRDILARVGGFEALRDELADDAVLGRLVREQGLRVALAPTVPATTVPETQMPALFEHELRWARTIKSVTHAGFVSSALQYPLFWAMLCLALSGGQGWAFLLFLGAWGLRAVTAAAIDRNLAIASRLPIWCLPARDLLSMSVILASYRTRRVAWRGQVLLAGRARLVPGKG